MTWQLDQLNLPAFLALRGYRSQAQLQRELEAAGRSVPQPVLSRMWRGEQVYPKARQRVAEHLGLELEQLDGLVERSAA